MIIQRKMSWIYGLRKFSIYIDEVNIGMLGIRQTKIIELSPGEHTVCLSIDGDISCEKVIIQELDNLKLKCRISPVLDVSYFIPILVNILTSFLLDSHTNPDKWLVVMISWCIPIVIHIIFSAKNKMINIKKYQIY